MPSSFSKGGISSSILSSSMLSPNLIILWILLAKCVGSSRENPEVNNEVSNNNQIKSFTVLSDLSLSLLFLSSCTMAFSALISIVFFETMYDDIEESRNAWAFMILSILADQPYSPVTKTQGEWSTLWPTTTFSTLSPKTSLINLHKGSNEAFYSSNFFFFSSESSNSIPSLVQFFNFLPSYSFNY